MTTFITVYHDEVVITNEIGRYEFVGMKNETFLLNRNLQMWLVWCAGGWVGWMSDANYGLKVELISG
jgi:hypothetical protein